jgi:1-acyl-sn-glycerol-3-phosphate acyltransferase
MSVADIDVRKGTIRPFTRAIVRNVIYAILWLLAGMRVTGARNVPKEGPFILVVNHLHNLDPLMVQVSLSRNCHFFVKQEVFKYPVASHISRWSGGFPVNRGAPDRQAIRMADAALAAGIGVGIFPEGTRSTTFALQKGMPGAGLVAVRNDVPIIPLVITGSERLPLNGKKGKLRAGMRMPNPEHRGVRLVFGEPFRITPASDGKRVGAAEATNQIMLKLAEMLPPDYRGVYADGVPSDSSAAT